MISAEAFVEGLRAAGIGFVAGVPCSSLAGPIQLLADDPDIRYLGAVNEGAALAAAAGAWLGGTPSAVMLQNSGFGNLLNPLTSLTLPYGIPVLLIVGMRGLPPHDEEPQHVRMGRNLPTWLESLALPSWWLTMGDTGGTDPIGAAAAALRSGVSAAIIVEPGAVAGVGTYVQDRVGDGVRRTDLVRALADLLTDEYVFSTTGYLSRELYGLSDRPKNFYMQGSMGHVASLALGACVTRPNARIVVLDGDGSLAMHMGALVSIGAVSPRNLIHLVFDNGAYESTGGQVVTSSADICAIARACGYRTSETIDSASDLRPKLRHALRNEGPLLIRIAGLVGGAPGKRASAGLPLTEVAHRFRARLSTKD